MPNSTPDVKVIAEMLDTLEDAARDVFGNLHPRFLEIRAALCDRVEELEAANAALRARNEELKRWYAIGGERSWALSAVLAHIDDTELSLIVRKLTVADIDRFAAVVEGYHNDLARAASQGETDG